jgi:mono/diheme cytochrome c family protein
MHAAEATYGVLLSITLATTLALGPALATDVPPDGTALFASHCARCHGQSGKANTSTARALKVRPLVNDAHLAKMAPADIVRAMRSNPKHQGVGAPVDLGDGELEPIAVFVKDLAKQRRRP